LLPTSGYCDAQCYTTPFINGVANIKAKGSCCNELDIWEANSRATHLAPHPCSKPSLYLCDGAECAFDGVCDKRGCGYNPYRVGNHDYYGPSRAMKVDTSRPFTVVTQFPTNKAGEMLEIHRLYIQDGKIVQNAKVKVDGPPKVNFMNDEYCEATGSVRYMDLGATAGMGAAAERGMVLAFSIWWDAGGFMKWLDADGAGPCGEEEGDPKNIVRIEPHPVVSFGNIKWGEIGSTYADKCRSKHCV
jgi:cellulase